MGDIFNKGNILIGLKFPINVEYHKVIKLFKILIVSVAYMPCDPKGHRRVEHSTKDIGSIDYTTIITVRYLKSHCLVVKIVLFSYTSLTKYFHLPAA